MGAPNGNPNDNTQLGTAEVISDEYIDPSLGSRLDQNQVPTGYKMPRSKIAIGPYGQDGGDASQDRPLPAESRAQRQIQETTSVRERTIGLASLQRYASETVSLSDSRGADLTTRGVR